MPTDGHQKDNLILLLGLPIILMAAHTLWAGTEQTPPRKDEKPKKVTVYNPYAAQIRLKDMAQIQGIRDNQLIGQGLVIGLNGTGDSGSIIADQQMANVIRNFGTNIDVNTIGAKNAAGVIITAILPPFAKPGSLIDVQVSSIGDAKSLTGGILIQAPLKGADGRVYAVAQGALSVGGFQVGGGKGDGEARVAKNHPVVGRIPAGAIVEREVPMSFAENGMVTLRLNSPDFMTAKRIVDAVNKEWPESAFATDHSAIRVQLPGDLSTFGGKVGFLAALQAVTVIPDAQARVVINERTGTIVAGAHVRIAPTTIAHGNLNLTIKDSMFVDQPPPFAPESATTVVTVDQTTTTSEDIRPEGVLVPVAPGPTLGELSRALNALRVSSRDIMVIFQALKTAGALHADLISM